MSKTTVLNVDALISGIQTAKRVNSDFDAEKHYFEGVLLELIPSRGKRTNSKGEEVPTTKFTVQTVNGMIVDDWVDDSTVTGLLPTDIGAPVMLHAITFASEAGYEKAGIKAGGTTIMYRSLAKLAERIVEKALTHKERITLQAEAFAKAGVSVISAS